jgi:RNA recognition motif-containing protein
MDGILDFVQASYDKKQLDVGANLFIGNLDPMVDENILYNAFSAFGQLSQTAKVSGRISALLPMESLTRIISPAPDRTRPSNRRVKRIRFRLVQRL